MHFLPPTLRELPCHDHTPDREIFDAIFDATNNYRGKVVIIVGDIKQILGISDDNTRECILRNAIIESKMWRKFRIYQFTTNLRLLQATNNEEAEIKRKFLNTIEHIAMGTYNYETVFPYQTPTGILDNNLVCIKGVDYVTDSVDAINFLYPHGFDPNIAQNCMIMAVTNKQVDEWNEKIQMLNPGEATSLIAKDEFYDVDDQNGELYRLLETNNITKTNKPNVPPHNLKLKVGDICFLTHKK